MLWLVAKEVSSSRGRSIAAMPLPPTTLSQPFPCTHQYINNAMLYTYAEHMKYTPGLEAVACQWLTEKQSDCQWPLSTSVWLVPVYMSMELYSNLSHFVVVASVITEHVFSFLCIAWWKLLNKQDLMLFLSVLGVFMPYRRCRKKQKYCINKKFSKLSNKSVWFQVHLMIKGCASLGSQWFYAIQHISHLSSQSDIQSCYITLLFLTWQKKYLWLTDSVTLT